MTNELHEYEITYRFRNGSDKRKLVQAGRNEADARDQLQGDIVILSARPLKPWGGPINGVEGHKRGQFI